MRDAYFDNAKAILIILVVIGHILELFLTNDSRLLLYIYQFIYIFHMPAFAILSGFFAKKVHNLTRAELKYIWLYIIFTIIFTPFSGRPLLINLIIPYRHLWYLLSLSLWYSLIQFIKYSKLSIILSLIVAIMAGYFDRIGIVGSASRIIVLFPFFLTGYFASKMNFHLFRPKTAAILLFVIFILLTMLDIDSYWLYNADSYARLGVTEIYAGVYRLLLLLIYALSTACFFSLVPQKRHLITQIGTKTLWIYLLHEFFIILVINLVR